MRDLVHALNQKNEALSSFYTEHKQSIQQLRTQVQDELDLNEEETELAEEWLQDTRTPSLPLYFSL